MLKVAITGGAGSGKSTVARMFKELGAMVLDADGVAKDAVAVGQPAWEELRRWWGPEFFLADGELNRAKVAQLVFSDPQARRRLNEIVHPRVIREIQARLKDLERQGVELALVEVPLLFEAGLADRYDRVIVVYAEPGDQMGRLKDRDQRQPEEIAGILQAQWPLKDKAAKADYVIDNGGTLSSTRQQVEKIWGELQKIILTGKAKKVSVP
jgi:dephospho-CoA kinase